MTTIKVLGTGCVTRKRLLADINKMVTRNNWQAQVEYVTDLSTIMSYGMMSTPVLVVNEKVLLTGHPGTAKVEYVLRQEVTV